MCSGGGTAAREGPEIYKEELELCGFKMRAGGTTVIVPVLSHPPHKAKSETALTWLTLLAPASWLPETLPPPTHVPLEALMTAELYGHPAGEGQISGCPVPFAELPQAQ